jgi:hypothetical protein
MASRSWKKIVFYAYKETEGTSSSAASAAATAATNYKPISFV